MTRPGSVFVVMPMDLHPHAPAPIIVIFAGARGDKGDAHHRQRLNSGLDLFHMHILRRASNRGRPMQSQGSEQFRIQLFRRFRIVLESTDLSVTCPPPGGPFSQ